MLYRFLFGMLSSLMSYRARMLSSLMTLIFRKCKWADISVYRGDTHNNQLASGQKINVQVTVVLQCWRRSAGIRLQARQRIGSAPTDADFKYLGGPIFHGRPTTANFTSVWAKIEDHLAHWSFPKVSFACRRALLSAVLMATPVHLFRTFAVPQSILHQLERSAQTIFMGQKLE